MSMKTFNKMWEWAQVIADGMYRGVNHFADIEL